MLSTKCTTKNPAQSAIGWRVRAGGIRRMRSERRTASVILPAYRRHDSQPFATARPRTRENGRNSTTPHPRGVPHGTLHVPSFRDRSARCRRRTHRRPDRMPDRRTRRRRRRLRLRHRRQDHDRHRRARLLPVGHRRRPRVRRGLRGRDRLRRRRGARLRSRGRRLGAHDLRRGHRARPEGLRLQPAAVLDHRGARRGGRLQLAVLRDHAGRHHDRGVGSGRRHVDRRSAGTT